MSSGTLSSRHAGDVDSDSVVVRMLRYIVRSLEPTVHCGDAVPRISPEVAMDLGKRYPAKTIVSVPLGFWTTLAP